MSLFVKPQNETPSKPLDNYWTIRTVVVTPEGQEISLERRYSALQVKRARGPVLNWAVDSLAQETKDAIWFCRNVG